MFANTKVISRTICLFLQYFRTAGSQERLNSNLVSGLVEVLGELCSSCRNTGKWCLDYRNKKSLMSFNKPSVPTAPVIQILM